MKASYYKLAKIHHPDRVPVTEKIAAQERFNIIHLAYSVLANPETKSTYDAGDTDMLYSKPTVTVKWEQYIKTAKTEDIQSAKAKYQGTSDEETDVLREFQLGNGSLTHLVNVIPFMRIEDENRIVELLKRCMEIGKIKKMPIRKIRR